MDHKKETRICLIFVAVLVILGIVMKRVFGMVVGLYACHITAGGFLLLAGVCYFLPDNTEGSQPPQPPPV